MTSQKSTGRSERRRRTVPEPEHEPDFPPGLSQPALQALRAAGYTRLDQLATVTETDLLKLHGMGPKGIRILREALRAKGTSFASR